MGGRGGGDSRAGPSPYIMPPVFGERGQTLFGHSAKNQGQAPVSDVQGKNEEYEEGYHTVCVWVSVYTYIKIQNTYVYMIHMYVKYIDSNMLWS